MAVALWLLVAPLLIVEALDPTKGGWTRDGGAGTTAGGLTGSVGGRACVCAELVAGVSGMAAAGCGILEYWRHVAKSRACTHDGQ